MPKRLPHLQPPQDPLLCHNHTVWPQRPIDKRQPCHELMAQLLMHVSHSAPSEERNYEHQD